VECSLGLVADGVGGLGDVVGSEGFQHADGEVAEGRKARGAVPAWTVEASSAKVTSLMWCEELYESARRGSVVLAVPLMPYSMDAMESGRYSIEIEPEVRLWLENIPAQHYKQTERVADLLAEQPITLDEPHSRHLGGKLRELRFRLGDAHQRITYWLAPGRRVVLLTVFRKTKMREQAEVDRAHAAQRLCEVEHQAAAEHDLYSRNLKENR
jgi:phage-related protein